MRTQLHRKGHSPPSSTPWGTAPQFSAHVCYDQTAGWINMPLDTKVGLGPGHTVTWGPSHPQKEAQPPIFSPCLLWPNGRPSQLLLSTCCTSHDRKSLYFTMSAPIPQNCRFPWGIWTPHLTHDSLGPSEPVIRMAPRWVQPIFHR